MQKTKKSANRLLALLLSIMMLVSMLPLSVFAEETTCLLYTSDAADDS